MTTITNENAHEFEVHEWTTEASDLGWKPGQWPRTIATTLGNKMVFIAQRREERDGDLLWVDYIQGNGCIRLRVFND